VFEELFQQIFPAGLEEMVKGDDIVAVADELGFVPDLDQLVLELADEGDHFISDPFQGLKLCQAFG
jgi:hypothetical protein